MRKRIASLFLVLALCLSLLPTAALAEEIPETTPGDTIPANESTQEPEVDEAVEAVRSAINALPSAEDWADLTAEEQETAAEDASAAYEAYEELTEEQQTALSGELEKLIALFGKINSEVAPLSIKTGGTEDNPCIVSSAEEWAALFAGYSPNYLSNNYIKLNNDIDLGGTEWNSRNLQNSVLDGNGHSITNAGKPLFSGLYDSTVKNLAIVGANITGSSGQNVGILATSTSGDTVTIQNCYVSGSITGSGNGIGGLIGQVGATTTIQNCAADVTVKNTRTGGYAYGVGGLVGYVTGTNQLTISYCYATGTAITGARGAGGLVGAAPGSRTITVDHSVALQSEVSNGNYTSYEGRLAGGSYFNDSTFTSDYAYADMIGAQQTNKKYDPTVARNGADVSKAACTTADFW